MVTPQAKSLISLRLITLLTAAFCARSALGQVPAASTPKETPRRFSHRTHVRDDKGSKCSQCHTEGALADRERPAKQDHAACNAEGCHAEEFFTVKMSETDLCYVCHVSKEWKEFEKKRANIRSFPRGRERDAESESEPRTFFDDWDFYAEFSHKTHVGKGGPVREKSDEGCLFCHKISLKPGTNVAVVIRPGHDQCAGCHDGTAGAPSNAMSDCGSCHLHRRTKDGTLVPTGPVSKRRKGRVSGKFSHEKHRLDRRRKDSTPTSCGVCHDLVTKAATLGQIKTTAGQRTMETACKTCHDGKQRTADGQPIFDITGQCTLCHQPSFLDGDTAPLSHR